MATPSGNTPRRPLPRWYGLLIIAAIVITILAVIRIAGGDDDSPADQGAPTSSAPTSATSEAAQSPSSSPPPSKEKPSRPTEEAPAEEISIAFTGDMLPSDELQEQAQRNAEGDGYDFMPMLREVAPIIQDADWAICHQETPVSDNNIGVAGYPLFNAPWQLAEAEAEVGYDACSTASNHSVDLGAGGVQATLDKLDKFGIEHTGTARTQEEAETLRIYDVKGVKVGHLSYTYGLNGIPLPQPWMVNVIDTAKIRDQAHALKAAGADIVIVSIHAGDETVQTPSAYQVQIDNEIMQSPDVDLVVGHHAHVVQPIKRLDDGRWIVYGVGNLLAQQEVLSSDPTPPHRDGVIVRATFSKDGDDWQISQMGYVPTFVDAPTDVVRLAPDFSRQRTVAALTSMGAPLVDLTP